MPVICPAVLAADPHEYREQMERVAPFAERVQIDLTDGVFAKNKTVELSHIWWLKTALADIHLMYKSPENYLKDICKLQPSLLIVHAEADGDFLSIAETLHNHGIKAGVALLPETPVDKIKQSLPAVDHVLVFAGKLGHFGGQPDMSLTDKVRRLKDLRPELEIGWDGGVSVNNVAELVAAGVDVLNAGGAIQRAEDPVAAYAKLKANLQEAENR